MERFELDGRVILAWPRAFSAEECVQLAGRVPWPSPLSRGYQGVVSAPELARDLGLLCVARMPGAPVLEWLDDVTMTVDRQMRWHVDEPRGATHKLALYLDEVEDGGTVFRDASQARWVCPAGAQGSLVLFDIGIEHQALGAEVGRASLVLRLPRRVAGLRARVVG